MSDLCYISGIADKDEPAERALMTSSSAAITSQDSVNRNLVTVMVDSGASGHYFDDATIHYLKYRPQDYVHLATPRTVLTTEGALLDGTAKGVLQGLVTDNYSNKTLDRVDIVLVSRIERNLSSATAAVQKGLVTIFDYEKPRLEGFNVTVPLRSESGNLDSFVLDLSADGYGPRELAMNAVTNTQMQHRRLGHLYAHSLEPHHQRNLCPEQ